MDQTIKCHILAGDSSHDVTPRRTAGPEYPEITSSYACQHLFRQSCRPQAEGVAFSRVSREPKFCQRDRRLWEILT